MSSIKKSQGFTLIELVIVVIIIGLLAIIAIPKYIEISEKARNASVESIAAIYAASAISVRTQWVANGRSQKSSKTADDLETKYNHVEFDGALFWLTDGKNGFKNEGYPVSVDHGAYSSIITDQNCVDLMTALMQNPPTVLPVSQAVQVEDPKQRVHYLAQANGQTCTYFQQEGANNFFVYEMVTGNVSVELQP